MSSSDRLYAALIRAYHTIARWVGINYGVSRRIRYLLMFFFANPALVEREKKKLLARGTFRCAEDRALMEKASHRISPFDTMYSAHAEHYYSLGLAAFHLINKALAEARSQSMRNILDMGCGYGRVMRFLAAAFPDAALTACDIESRAVKFCSGAFCARAVQSSGDFKDHSLTHSLTHSLASMI